MENRASRGRPDAHRADETAVPNADTRPAGHRAVLDLLEQGTEAILTSDGFADYLRMLARFHHYSFANVLLIHAQRPEATLVNAYHRWQTLGRQVRKGEQGIKIVVPHLQRRRTDPAPAGDAEEDDPGAPERILTTFGIGHVFDIAQTEGEPLPEPPPITELTDTTDAATALHLKLTRFLIDEGLLLSSEPMAEGRRGYWHPGLRTIALRQPAGTHPMALGPTRTLAHEAAHYLAEHRGSVARADAECVAEGAAFMTLHHAGLDTGMVTFPYVASWARDRQVLRRNLREIQQIGDRLITAIAEVGDPYADGYGADPGQNDQTDPFPDAVRGVQSHQ